MNEPEIRHLVVMGVSGAGKTTLAKGVVEATGWEFLEGDSMHPRANVAKMASGTPLTDEDRWPWLRAIADWIDQREAEGVNAVIACSALKRSYRDLLRQDRPHVEFFLIDVPEDELRRRLEEREDHFMKVSMLRSQLDTLERLEPDEPGITLRSSGDEDEALRRTIELLGVGPDDQAGSA